MKDRSFVPATSSARPRVLSLYLCFFSGLFLCLPSASFAEVHQCGDVWSSTPCGQESAKKNASDEQRTSAKELSRKKSLFHELTMKSIRAKREHDLDFSLSEVEDFCFKQDSSLADCDKQINQASDRIDSKISQLALIKQQERANKLREDANRLQRERNLIDTDRPTVVVDQRRHVYVPAFRSGQLDYVGDGYRLRRSRSSAGVSISLSGSGSYGGTAISVRGNAAHSVSNHSRSHRGPVVNSIQTPVSRGGTSVMNVGSR